MNELTKNFINDGLKNVPVEIKYKPLDSKWLDENPKMRPVYLGEYFYRIQSFAEVLFNRESTIKFKDELSLTLQDLSSVLFPYTIRGETLHTDGYKGTHRYVPSAGARHPCELIVLANKVDGLARGYWRFDGLENRLIPLNERKDIDDVMDYIQETTSVGWNVPALIFLEAYFERTLSRYPHGLSMVYLDAGCLLGNLHLAATASGLPSTILGRTGVLGVRKHSTDIGCLVLGKEKYFGSTDEESSGR